VTSQQELISIIIPHLNQEGPLRRCLASLHTQTNAGHPLEIIVVDNGSRTAPNETCKSFDGVRLAHEDTPGPGPARNKGIAVSSAAILAFIDSDCIADPGWIAAIGEAFCAGSGHQIIGGDVQIAVADPKKLTMLEAYESIFAYRQQEYIEKQGYSGTGNLAMRRACFEKVGPFAGIHLAEDWDWGRRAQKAGLSTAYVPGMIVYHPARKNFAELCVKWDRHIDHSFEEYRKRPFWRLRWIIYALAVAVSPMFEIRRILTSPRVPAFRDKGLALRCLVLIRPYRVWRMFSRLFDGNLVSGNKDWNRG